MSGRGRSRSAGEAGRSGRPTGRPVDQGSVTIEAAIGLAALALVLALCLAGTACLLAQLRCADAAREAVRLAARGDDSGAADAVSALAPGASLALSGEDLVTATVRADPIGGLLPGVVIVASASAAREPSGVGP